MFNNVCQFILSNSGVLFAILLALIGIFQSLLSKNKQKVYANIPGLITSVQTLEINNDSKFQKVLDISYGLIPKVFKLFISEQDISNHIQFIFDRLKQFAKEQAKAEATKDFIAIAEDNIAGKNVTGGQQAAEVKANVAIDSTKQQGINCPVGDPGVSGVPQP